MIPAAFKTRTILLALCGLAAWSGAARAQETVAPRTDLALRASYAPVVERAAPAVVNVFTKRKVRSRSSLTGDPFFDRFFQFRGGVRERVESSLGSGVIVGADGVIVTNHHVVKDAAEITVVLADRREFEAEVVLTDEQTDLAILRVEASGLPALAFANSDAAAVGDVVLAIGNPFGVGQTVTSGIVSATARSATSVSDYQFFLQTDAAINPGNSGGALVDVDGRLLGVNTAIYSRSGGSNGIGFAIPGNLVARVVASAVGGERVVRRPWLGVSASAVDARLAQAVGLDRPRGAIVGEVFGGGPAARAGLREGDVVLSVDGQDVFEPEALRYRPATLEVGARIPLTVLRDGEERQLNATLALPPETPARAEITVAEEHPLGGATLATLSPALAEELGRDPFGPGGVVVTQVAPRSLAARYGVRRGARVLSVNEEETRDTAAVTRALRQAPSRYLLLVENENGTGFRVRTDGRVVRYRARR